jgi:hypothetical protein
VNSTGAKGALSETSSERRREDSEIAGLLAFRRMGTLVAQALASMMGPLASEETAIAGRVADDAYAAHVVLSLVSNESELCVSVVLEREFVDLLTMELCGAPLAPEDLAGFLGEIANIASGIVHRSAAEEGAVLARNLPSQGRGGLLGSGPERSWWLHRVGTGLRIGLIASVRSRPNQRVAAGDLRERMVVAHDVRDADGASIVDAGTCLTETTAERVQRAVGADREVDVAIVT